MPTAIIDGITTRYEVSGSGPPILMYSPAGFDATLATSAARYLEECLQQAEYWDVAVEEQTEEATNKTVIEFLDKVTRIPA